MSADTASIRFRLPATSANLGPGFDTAAVALNFFLEVEAEPAPEFSVAATGRDAERCGQLEDNLVLDLYRKLLTDSGKPVVPLAIRMNNQIPLGMGCGSSAAGRLAAILLANHFGVLGWPSRRILAEAAQLEGHPDNASACWLGGFVAAGGRADQVHVARVIPPEEWRPIVVLPAEPLATSKARAVLPASYARADVVANLQAAAMLGLAFAQKRGDLLRFAMEDRIHQPYRAAICPLLPRLLPLAGRNGILGVALSGAGPAVLAIVDGEANILPASQAILAALEGLQTPELLVCRFESRGANTSGFPL
ncbi:MAG TPA: homoserine kinase [Terracidiphilus sp.]|jgi:homoserine kinase|nr:homoserine kinase [Terracidiphilus sp.]